MASVLSTATVWCCDSGISSEYNCARAFSSAHVEDSSEVRMVKDPLSVRSGVPLMTMAVPHEEDGVGVFAPVTEPSDDRYTSPRGV